MPFIDINSDAVIRFTATLERLHKSALPVAVRTSLTSAAFDVKTKTMPITSKVFVPRAPTFFKATSKAVPAKGFDIKSMQSEVGFMPQVGAKESGGATLDLQQQENAGIIGHRAFIPLKQARAGGSWNRRVKSANTLAAIHSRQSVKTKSSIVDAKQSAGRNDKAKWFSSAIAAGKGGYVIGTGRRKGSRVLLRINSITRDETGKTIINSTPLYSVKGHRAAKIKQTKFMQKASLMSAEKIEKFYIIEAEKQIKKAGG